MRFTASELLAVASFLSSVSAAPATPPELLAGLKAGLSGGVRAVFPSNDNTGSTPSLPALPSLGVDGTPSLPSLPALPSLAIPGTPSLSGLPTLPSAGLPSIPSVGTPALPSLAAPALPSLALPSLGLGSGALPSGLPLVNTLVTLLSGLGGDTSTVTAPTSNGADDGALEDILTNLDTAVSSAAGYITGAVANLPVSGADLDPTSRTAIVSQIAPYIQQITDYLQSALADVNDLDPSQITNADPTTVATLIGDVVTKITNSLTTAASTLGISVQSLAGDQLPSLGQALASLVDAVQTAGNAQGTTGGLLAQLCSILQPILAQVDSVLGNLGGVVGTL